MAMEVTQAITHRTRETDMKKLITINGNVFHADCIALIEYEETTLSIYLANWRSAEDHIDYEYDSEDDARAAQLEAVKAWKEALS